MMKQWLCLTLAALLSLCPPVPAGAPGPALAASLPGEYAAGPIAGSRLAVPEAEMQEMQEMQETQGAQDDANDEAQTEREYIKWLDFSIPAGAMEKAMARDIETVEEAIHIDWIAVLAVLGTRYGGDWNHYKAADMDEVFERLAAGETPEEILTGYKNYDYFYEGYAAVLGGFLGHSQRELPDKIHPGMTVLREVYGLKAFSPIAEGYSFSHYRDFGNARSYGYSRPHLGNDLTGSVGTPITAVEAGVIEEIGWNQYGGWRIGIRSFDGLRYYYYAHLRKDHPYAPGLQKGDMVQYGDVIGYLGMTGYSTTENVDGMKVPHLHFGMQLIFDESQKDGVNQIWIDVYDIVEFLNRNRTTVVRVEENDTVEYARKYHMYDERFPLPD